MFENMKNKNIPDSNQTQIRAALLGFEFLHHIEAVRLSVDSMRKKGVSIKIVAWSGRDGIKKEVENVFPDTKFMDGSKLQHLDISEFDEFCKYETISSSKNYNQLTKNEIRHLSYTLSRNHFMRQPQKVSAKEVKSLNKWLDRSVDLITQKCISSLFYVSPPHTIFDLTMMYAASRLNVPVIVLHKASFGDYMYAKPFLPASGNNATIVMDDESVKQGLSTTIPTMEVKEFLLSRSRNRGHLKISYQDKSSLARLPSIPVPNFFLKKGIYDIYRHVKIIMGLDAYYVFKKMEAVSIRTTTMAGRVYRMVMAYKNKSTIPKNLSNIILVALHSHPEQTSSPSAYGTPFEDEILTSLSRNFKNSLILAREHPAMLKKDFGSNYYRYRGPIFFNKIKKLKNVIYSLPGNEDDFCESIKAAKCVVAITGKIAFEAIMLGTPAVHLGYCSAAEGLVGLAVLQNINQLSPEMIDNLKADMNSSSVDDISKRHAEALSRYNPVPAFISGFHEKHYTKQQYIDSAAKVFVNMFRAGVKECQVKKTLPHS